MSDLNITTARVDMTTARKASTGIALAARSDGNVCFAGRFAKECFYAYDAGGVQLSEQAVRETDSVAAPFTLMVDGIARDGVSQVSVLFADGSSASAPIVDNTFEITKPNVTGISKSNSDIVGYVVDGTQYQWPPRPAGASG